MRDKHSANKLLVMIVGALVVLGGATGAVWVNRAHNKAVATQAKTVAVATTVPQTKAAMTTRVYYKGVAGKTALELLQQREQITTKDSAYGPYVDSIDGVKGGINGKYWSFYVNGVLAKVGANAYVTQNQDSIEWKLE